MKEYVTSEEDIDAEHNGSMDSMESQSTAENEWTWSDHQPLGCWCGDLAGGISLESAEVAFWLQSFGYMWETIWETIWTKKGLKL